MAFRFQSFVKSFSRIANNFWLVTGWGKPIAATPAGLTAGASNRTSFGQTFLTTPVLYVIATLASVVFCLFGHHFWALVGMAGLVVWPALAVMHFEISGATWEEWGGQLRKAAGLKPRIVVQYPE